MKTFKPFLLPLMLSLVIAVPVLAQDNAGRVAGPDYVDGLEGWKRTAQAAMPFLAKGAGARLMAMGDAGIAATGDVSSLFYNPAGIAYVEGRSLMVGNNSWLLDASIQSLALAVNLGQMGVVGFSFMNFNYGDPIMGTAIDATAEQGFREIGEFTPSEFFVGVSFARRISAQFAVGAQVKYARQDLLGGDIKTRVAFETPDGWVQEDHDAKTGLFAIDIGTIYNTGFRDLQLAMSFRNFGGEVKYERESFDIPLNFHFGVSGSLFQLLDMQMDNMDLDMNLEYLHPRDWSERVKAGLEYSFNDMVFVRGGYKWNYSSEGLCLGAGVNVDLPMGGVRIDYAFKDTGDSLFETVHVYSLSIDF